MDPASPPGRLLSVDAFRGFTIAAMLLVNNPGSWDYVYRPLDHAEWNGWTPTDLIFPFFLVIVGVAIALALGRRLQESPLRRPLVTKIVVRFLALFALGLLLNGFPRYDLATIRVMGVLQRIAVVYLLTALAYLYLSPGAGALPPWRCWSSTGP